MSSVFERHEEFEKDRRGVPMRFVNQNPSRAKQKSQSALVVSFDERKRKDFVGGFHRRRLERKKQAAAEQAEVDRLAKIEARRLRRVQVRQRIETDKLTNPFGELDGGDDDDDDDSANNGDSARGSGGTGDNDDDNDDNGDAPTKRSIIDEADALLAGDDDDNDHSRVQQQRKKHNNDGDHNVNDGDSKKKKRKIVNDNDDNDDDEDDDNKPKKLKFRGESAVATVLVEPLNVRRKDVHEIDRLIALSMEASRRNDEKSALQQARDAERREKRKAAHATGNRRKPIDKSKRR